ncbi:unnamed protein product, partial [marine sediment metagenome]
KRPDLKAHNAPTEYDLEILTNPLEVDKSVVLIDKRFLKGNLKHSQLQILHELREIHAIEQGMSKTMAHKVANSWEKEDVKFLNIGKSSLALKRAYGKFLGGCRI